MSIPAFPRFTAGCLFFACLCATPLVRSAELLQATVTDAVQRGLLGKLPAQFSLHDVSFTEVSRVDTEVTLKGEARFAASEDTFVGVRRLGLKRPSGELYATILRRVHTAGDTFTAPFSGVLSLLDPASRLTPKLDIAAQGQPRTAFKATVIEGTDPHKKLLELDQALATADERYQRVKGKWDKLMKIRSLLGSYDEFTSEKWENSFFVGQLLEKGLDNSDLRKAYFATVAKKKNFPDRRAQHATFVKLVQPAFAPEFARINAIVEAQSTAAKAYVEFLEQL